MQSEAAGAQRLDQVEAVGSARNVVEEAGLDVEGNQIDVSLLPGAAAVSSRSSDSVLGPVSTGGPASGPTAGPMAFSIVACAFCCVNTSGIRKTAMSSSSKTMNPPAM